MRRLLLCALLAACTGDISGAGERDGSLPDGGTRTDDAAPPPPCGEAGAAILFFEQRCARCHQGSRTYPDLTREGLANLAELESEGMPGERLLVPGDPESSWLYRKMAHMQGDEGGAGMPLGLDRPVEELPMIETWIRNGANTACDELAPPVIPYDPNALDQATLFSCSDPDAPRSSPARVRRIDAREFNSMAIGRAGTNPLATPEGIRYSTYAEDTSVEPSTLRLLMDQFPVAVRAWTVADPQGVGSTRMYGVSTRCIANDTEPSDECIDTYVETLFVRGGSFRSPTEAEFGRLRTLLVDAIAREEAESIPRTETLELVSQAARLSVSSLFRAELGENADARRRLTNEELALVLGHLISTDPVGVPVHSDPSGTLSPMDPDLDTIDEGRLGLLRRAADDGSIGETETRRTLFRHYAGGEIGERRPDLPQRGNDTLARGQFWLNSNLIQFFREWLGYEDANTVFKEDHDATSAFEDDDTGPSFSELRSSWNGIEGTLSEQLDDLIARVVIETDRGDGDVFETLLTTRLWHLPSNLGSATDTPCSSPDDCGGGRCPSHVGLCYGSTARSHYWKQAVFGVRDVVGESRDDRWVTMGETRMGVLTHPAWLAAHGANFEDDASLIERGNWIRQQLFCQSFGSLDDVQGLVAMLPTREEGGERLSAWERVYQATENPEVEGTQACFGCHQFMNSLGKPFELFNHAGFERAYDHSGVPDGSTVIDNLPDESLNGSYATPIEFIEAVSQSRYARRGFIRHAFRYFMGRDEVLEDGCTLAEMEQALDDTGSFFTMLEALISSDTFVYRHTPEGSAR